MSAAPANGLNFYVVFKGLEENSVVPADGSISDAKIASSAVTSAKIGSGAVTDAKLASSAVTDAKIASGAVTDAKLASALSFSGKTVSNFTNPNGFNLLSTYDATASNVNYNSDVEIHDIGATNLAIYSQFLVHSYLLNQTNGNAHVYFSYKGSNGSVKGFQGQIAGAGSQAVANTPFQGDGTYIRTAFRLPSGHFNMVKQVISNAPTTSGMPSAGAEYYGIIYELQWVYSGVQSAHAQGAVRGTSNATPTQKIYLNMDGADSGAYTGDGNFRVISHLWGVK
jgi:hypothetical protein